MESAVEPLIHQRSNQYNRKTSARAAPLLPISVLTSGVLCASLVLPVAAASDARQIEEVVVSAQKREESVLDVPISMTVLGAEEISALNVFDFTETAQLTPGVDLFPGVQTAAIRLRGVGPGAYALTAPQSVAVFIDDIAQGSVGAAFSTLVDIERLELLRGPQGTLYGQNAPGGAYNISTKTPNTQEVEGYVETSYGQQNSSDLESVDLRGAINLPLVEDRLALRIAGVYADSDGYVKVRNATNPENSSGGKEHQSLRSRMAWNINEDMDLLWTVNYQDLRDNGLDFNVEGFVPGTGGDNPTPATTNRFDDRDYYADFNSEAETDLTDTSLHFRWAHSATNIDILASWQDFKTFNLDNRTPYPGFDNKFAIQLDWETETVELRFSDTGEKLDYIAGLFYANRDIDGFFDVDLSGVNLVGPAEGEGDINAIFANLTFHINDKWDLTAGARYDKNEIWTISTFEFLGLDSVVDDDASFDHLSWSFKLRHFITEKQTAYLAIDNAYKQGGFNNLIPGLVSLAPIFPELAAVGEEMLMFDEETSTAIEIGIKGSAADGRLNYSLAVFYQEFQDHQIAQPTGVEAFKTPLGDLNALFAAQLTNADEVLTKGIELELAYLLGNNWDTTWRLGYFDATIEDWQFRFCGEGEEESPNQIFCPLDGGEPLNSLPKWNSNFQLGHLRSVTETLMFYGRFNWTWRSSANNPRRTKDYSNAKSIFGLSLGLQSTTTGLDIRLWGKNLTDEDLNIDPSIRSDGDPSLPQPFSGRYFPGREYGLTLSYEF